MEKLTQPQTHVMLIRGSIARYIPTPNTVHYASASDTGAPRPAKIESIRHSKCIAALILASAITGNRNRSVHLHGQLR